MLHGGQECAKVAPVPNFNQAKYLGRWYEHSRSIDAPGETGECVTADYSLRPDSQIKVENT